MQQPTGQIQAPAHATGIGAAAAIEPLAHAEELSELINAATTGSRIEVIEAGLQLQELAATEDLVDRHLLGHVAQLLAGSTRIGYRIDSSDLHRAGIGGQQGAENPQAGGLASTIGAEQAIEAAGRHVQAHPIEGLQVPIALAELIELNHGGCQRRPSLKSRCSRQGEQAHQLGAEVGCHGRAGQQQQ